MTTATLAPLVLLDDLNRRLGYPRGQLERDPAAYGLEVRPDWAGRPSVTDEQAAALVGRVTEAQAAALRSKRQANHAHAAAAATAEQRLDARARAAFDAAAAHFGDAALALALYYVAGDPAISDTELARQLGDADARWRQGFRTLQPELGPGMTDQEARDLAELRHHTRRALEVLATHQAKLRELRRREGP